MASRGYSPVAERGLLVVGAPPQKLQSMGQTAGRLQELQHVGFSSFCSSVPESRFNTCSAGA